MSNLAVRNPIFRGFVIMLTMVFLGFTAGSAHAGSAAAGTVTRVMPNTSNGTNGEGVFFFFLSSTHTGAPACHNQGTRWVVDLGKTSGTAIQAVVLGAYLSGKTITVYGANICNIWGDTESVSAITSP
jgi:hypothetical protein